MVGEPALEAPSAESPPEPGRQEPPRRALAQGPPVGAPAGQTRQTPEEPEDPGEPGHWRVGDAVRRPQVQQPARPDPRRVRHARPRRRREVNMVDVEDGPRLPRLDRVHAVLLLEQPVAVIVVQAPEVVGAVRVSALR